MTKLILLDKNNKLISAIEIKQAHHNVTLKRQQSILDILLDNQISAKHGCTGGVCGACICKIIEGEEFILKEGLHKTVHNKLSGKRFLSCIATIKENTPEEAIIKLKARTWGKIQNPFSPHELTPNTVITS